ncbi:MAG: alpha/beta hydrolase [Rhodobacteraceae bacterium]|nr:alpha/beta hydrolase [Paracoccaceae bacterium]
MSGAQFRLFQIALSEDRLVTCPDTPGFGGSDGPGSPVKIPDYAGAMADLLDGLGYGQSGSGPIDIVGCHTGTLIGTELAVARPDLVRKLALPSLALLTAEERAKLKTQFGGPQPILTDADLIPRIWRQTVMTESDGVTPERRLEMFTERLRSGTKSWFGPEASLNYDCESRLRLVQQPVLLLVLDEMLGPNTRRAADVVAHPTLVDVSDRAGHSAWDVAPELLASEIRSFFDAP